MTKQQALEILSGLSEQQRVLLASLLPLIEAARPRAHEDARSEPPERRPMCSN